MRGGERRELTESGEELELHRRFFEATAVSGCDREAAFVADATSNNTKVSCFDPDCHIGRFEIFLQSLKDLLCQAFLDLGTARKVIDDAIELGEADDALMGDISDVSAPKDRKKVMLAARMQADIALDQHLLVAVMICKGCELWPMFGGKAAKDLLDVHLRHALGGIAQAVVLKVKAKRLEDLGKKAFYFLDFFLIVLRPKDFFACGAFVSG